MLKRILSVVLAVLLVLATAAVASAHGSAPAVTGDEDQVIFFNAESAGWYDAEYVGFHIWEIGGKPISTWGSKAERGTLCKEYNEEGEEIDIPCFIWKFDFAAKGITLDPGKQYGVIFYNDKGGQTYDLLFDTTCYEDTADCDTDAFDKTMDGGNAAYPAYWRHQNPAVNGPRMAITPMGAVTGTCVPRNTTVAGLFKDYLTDGLGFTREHTGMTDHQIVENLAEELHMTVEEVQVVIESSGVEVDWDCATSALEHRNPAPGDADLVSYTVDVSEGLGTARGDRPYLTINYSLPPDYQYGEVTLTAVPAEGYRFVGWEIEGEYEIDGDATLASAVLPLKVHTGIAAHARFQQEPEKPGQAVLRGDYDGDGEVTILDATRAQRIIAGLDERPSEDFLKAIDADGDNELTILDATRIQRVIAGICGWDGKSSKPGDDDELPFVPK